MPLPGPLLSLDVGTQTIGVAICDEARLLARPLTTLSRAGVKHDADAILLLARRHGVVGVVVGLPLALDGSETRSVRLARQIRDAVALVSGLPVAWQDERFTSVEAERRLLERGHSRAERKARIDQAAAAIILQDFLDSPDGRRFCQPEGDAASARTAPDPGDPSLR